MEQYGYGRYCWYPTEDYIHPVGTWKAVTGRGFDSCGPECPAPPPTPPPNPQVYDPKQNYCFKATHVDFDQYCWYHKDDFPVGNWKGKGGRGYNDCGQKCTEVYMYDPSRDTCFKDKVNDGKYCWWVAHRQVPHPYAQWEEVTGAAIDNCGAECTELMDPRGGEY